MALATWWRCDALPHLPLLPGFHATICDDDAMLAELNRSSIQDMRARAGETVTAHTLDISTVHP